MNRKLFSHIFLMCRPQYYSVSYRINPWMEPSENPSRWSEALKQWTELHHTILRLGGWIEYIEPQPGLPDMVFTANHALIDPTWEKIIVANFSHDERKSESLHVDRWFRDKGFTPYNISDHDFEGAGDALYAGDTLFCGYGIRSNIKAYTDISFCLQTENTVACRLVDDYFYHLDTCFCPLDDRNALVFSGAFDEPSVARMEEKLNLLHVPEHDARKFACNAVVLGKDIIIPAGCEDTERLLQDNGYNPHSVEMGEFIKAGGACKCCTLKLWENDNGLANNQTRRE